MYGNLCQCLTLPFHVMFNLISDFVIHMVLVLPEIEQSPCRQPSVSRLMTCCRQPSVWQLMTSGSPELSSQPVSSQSAWREHWLQLPAHLKSKNFYLVKICYLKVNQSIMIIEFSDIGVLIQTVNYNMTLQVFFYPAISLFSNIFFSSHLSFPSSSTNFFLESAICSPFVSPFLFKSCLFLIKLLNLSSS